MIHSITFKDPAAVEIPKSANVFPSYVFDLPAIKGRTFVFKPGLNIIVGQNGCGKTSLLNVIRHLTFCDGLFASSVCEGRSYWQLNVEESYRKGFWYLTELKMQYELRTYNLRRNTDMESHAFSDSTLNFFQTMRGFRHSDGENLMDTIKMMVMCYNHGDNWAVRKEGEPEPQKDENGHFPHHYFKKYVLDDIEAELGHSNTAYGEETWKTLLAYYKTNNDDTYKGTSFLMDEPDKGMDIHNVRLLYDMFAADHSKIQDIVVLHNVGLIHKLQELGDKVNFIEMTDGYLDEVENFFGRRVGSL